MKLQGKKTVRAPISDGEIIELYWQRDERAIEVSGYKEYFESQKAKHKGLFG